MKIKSFLDCKTKAITPIVWHGETPESNQGSSAVEYKWMPEGDGFTLYRIGHGARNNCGRLNTGASGSTHNLATLYNDAPRLKRERDALRDALESIIFSAKSGNTCLAGDNYELARAALALCENGVKS